MEAKKRFPLKRRTNVDQTMSFSSFSKFFKQLLEKQLKERITCLNAPTAIKDSMLYSLEAGGKRIRPLLLFATLEACGENPENGLLLATAIEMLHTYSLIHDDLPSMDNDDFRRGKPTNHKVFGEAIAVLAGDALLTYSFQLIADIPDEIASPKTKIQLISLLGRTAGAEGMVGGQVLDMNGERKRLSLEELQEIHIHKTGKLLQYSVLAGAILAKTNEENLKALEQFSYHLGLAFQIRDDILDVEGIEEKIGKPVGSDEIKGKNTYPSLLSLEGAKNALTTHIRLAKESLATTTLKPNLLLEITDIVGSRDH